jgi:hypothetical protein
MIKFMVGKSQRVMKGTYHENNCFFKHDVLSLITAVQTIEWMRKKDYLKRWVAPGQDAEQRRQGFKKLSKPPHRKLTRNDAL